MYAKLRNFFLRSGGYEVARRLHMRLEQRNLERHNHTFLQTGMTPVPDSVFFEPTQRCNLQCKMCYQDRLALAKPKERTLDQIINFFDRNRFFHKVTLCGGEIFVRRDVARLIRYLDQTRDIVISTNGTLIGDAEINLLRSCKRIVTVCISLDGPELLHDSIRGIRGSYDKTIHTIKALVSIVPVSITCVILNENLRFLPNIVEQCASMGVKKIKFELERIYTGTSKNQSLFGANTGYNNLPLSSGRKRSYSLEDFRNTIHECNKRARKAGVYLTFDPEFLVEEIEGCYKSDLRSRQNYICQAFQMATITPRGDLIHCYAIRKSFGNVFDFPFEMAWNSENAKSFRRELLKNNLTPACENCPHLRPIRKGVISYAA